jgi:hypothetical protein
VIPTHPDLLDVTSADSDPPGALLAPLTADGNVDLDALPHGTVVEDAELPRGAALVANKIAPGWQWRACHGEGWRLGQGYGPPRGDGSRPQLAILDPCRSVTLRAVAIDPAFDMITHHVLIGWVCTERGGKWKPDLAAAWSVEPRPDGRGRGRWTTRLSLSLGLSACSALLAAPPDVAVLARMIDRVARGSTGAAVDISSEHGTAGPG